MKRNLWLLMAMLLLVLAGCSNKPATSIDGKTESSETGTEGKTDDKTDQQNDDANLTDVSLMEYFLPDGSSAHYKGVGNEYAELDITVARPTQDYVVIHENNGGTFVQKVYKLNGDEIQVLQEEHIELDAGVPPVEELESMEPIRTYLKGPIEVGTTFDDWKIVEMNASVETPYQQFEDAVVIEQAGEDFVNRIYIVKDFGEVKRESTMSIEGEEEFVVTSSLETVTQP
ncbi:hypothetical protein [Sporosarcina ureae]|uniref:hypothetical protein n=1 Tax=Sporosarcina ureae TaxID=1571 RepID=UPI0026F23B83|nr:hypothetical protein [Sporosarcina ureae]